MAKVLPQIPNERLIELIWYGPLLLRDGILVKHPLEPTALPADKPGLYVATGDHPLYGEQVLLYIGQTGRLLSQRINEHTWLQEEWRLEVYITDVEDNALRNELEALLIYAHSPIYNSSHIGTPPALVTPLRIWNRGRFWRLFPEVSSGHDWYQPY
jgi:hypothetical protein